jgi:hypothetical protein
MPGGVTLYLMGCDLSEGVLAVVYQRWLRSCPKPLSDPAFEVRSGLLDTTTPSVFHRVREVRMPDYVGLRARLTGPP